MNNFGISIERKVCKAEDIDDIHTKLDTEMMLDFINKFGVNYIDRSGLKLSLMCLLMNDEQLDILFDNKPDFDMTHLEQQYDYDHSSYPFLMYVPLTDDESKHDLVYEIMMRIMDYIPMVYIQHKKDVGNVIYQACKHNPRNVKSGKIVLKVIENYEKKIKRFFNLMMERGDLNK